MDTTNVGIVIVPLEFVILLVFLVDVARNKALMYRPLILVS